MSDSNKNESFQTRNDERRAWHKFSAYLAPIIILPVLALGIKSLTFELFRVDGTSMETFLTQDDRLFVEKFGTQHAWITQDDYVPKRYEIVVFNVPNEYAEVASAPQFVKRVIALPGERVVITGGQTKVFSSESTEPIAVDEELAVELEREVVTDGDDIDMTVPEGHVFLMGDNRDESYDSREMGPIPSENLVGRVTVRLYPFDRLYML